MDVTCGVCSKPVADQARVCSACATRLEQAIGDIGWLEVELEMATGKQSAFTEANNVRSRNADTPIPFNAAASSVADELRNTLTTWVRLISEERGVPLPTANTGDRGKRAMGESLGAIRPSPQSGVERCDHTDLPTTDCQHCRERMPA